MRLKVRAALKATYNPPDLTAGGGGTDDIEAGEGEPADRRAGKREHADFEGGGGERAHAGPLYRRSHPYRAFVIMTLPFLAFPAVVLVPFVGWVILVVLLPVEMGRIGGRRLARNDALWAAAPAGAAVATYELSLILVVLQSIQGVVVQIDALGALFTLALYGFNMFFFSVGALSTAFDPHEPVVVEAPEVSTP